MPFISAPYSLQTQPWEPAPQPKPQAPSFLRLPSPLGEASGVYRRGGRLPRQIYLHAFCVHQALPVSPKHISSHCWWWGGTHSASMQRQKAESRWVPHGSPEALTHIQMQDPSRVGREGEQPIPGKEGRLLCVCTRFYSSGHVLFCSGSHWLIRRSFLTMGCMTFGHGESEVAYWASSNSVVIWLDAGWYDRCAESTETMLRVVHNLIPQRYKLALPAELWDSKKLSVLLFKKPGFWPFVNYSCGSFCLPRDAEK